METTHDYDAVADALPPKKFRDDRFQGDKVREQRLESVQQLG